MKKSGGNRLRQPSKLIKVERIKLKKNKKNRPIQYTTCSNNQQCNLKIQYTYKTVYLTKLQLDKLTKLPLN